MRHQLEQSAHAPLLAVATCTHKGVNQDSAVVLHHASLPIVGVAVADGLGSHHRSDLGSGAATAAAAASVAGVSDLNLLTMSEIFDGARAAIEQAALHDHAVSPEAVNLEDAYGTTLLCGLDLPAHLMVGYVGNGAVIHLRGDFDGFPPTQLLPWSAVNYLNPHSQMVRGTNVLYKWLGARTTPVQSSPSTLTITKDDELFGDILIVCSDGICSLDQTPIGLDADRRMWIQADRSVAILYEHLRAFFAHAPLTSEALGDTLREYVADLDGQGQVGDDCTIGVIVTATAHKYHATKRCHVEATVA